MDRNEVMEAEEWSLWDHGWHCDLPSNLNRRPSVANIYIKNAQLIYSLERVLMYCGLTFEVKVTSPKSTWNVVSRLRQNAPKIWGDPYHAPITKHKHACPQPRILCSRDRRLLSLDLKGNYCHDPNPKPGFATMTGMLIPSLNLILTRTNKNL